jgi:hypothetical protein
MTSKVSRVNKKIKPKSFLPSVVVSKTKIIPTFFSMQAIADYDNFALPFLRSVAIILLYKMFQRQCS